jgi:uncharacterized protein (TIGR02145 family)
MKTIKSSGICILVLLGLIGALTFNCNKKKAVFASLLTSEVSSITQNTAISGGNILNDGASVIISRGVCWSTSENPTIADNKTSDGSGAGYFTSTMTGLSGNTTYFLRAYATNEIGTSYGQQITFLTSPLLATLAPLTIAAITSFSCILNQSISNDGGTTITSRGICYGISHTPTTNDSKTESGSGIGSFVSCIAGLKENTTYYLRAFATNSVGTQYGDELSIKTMETISDVDGNSYSIVKIGTQIWMAENLKTTKYNDGTLISLQGSKNGIEGWYWDNFGSIEYKSNYGLLYNWYAVTNDKLCPIGWHVPVVIEWHSLIDYLGGFNVAGSKLKESGTSHWNDPNTDATNESGFTALPAGYLGQSDTLFHAFHLEGRWWADAPILSSEWCWITRNTESRVGRLGWSDLSITLGLPYSPVSNGFSVRCIKN